MTSAAGQVNFEQYEVVTGAAQRQTVLTGFLLEGPVAELAVVHVDENDERRLRIYAFGADSWAPMLDATLAPGVLFVDVVNIGGRDRLVTYEPGRLNWFDPDSATERALVSVTSNFNPPRRGEVPHVDLSRDVNDDDRNDLVVPDTDGFWVLIQMSDGAFADPVKIGPSTDMAGIYGADGYRYDPWSQSRIHEIDYNGDGRNDLVFWNEDHFEVHHQDERGLFAPVAEAFTAEPAFDSDQLFSLATGDMAGKVLHSLTDLNGDGVGDLVVFSLEGRTISSKRSAYEVHFGSATPEGGTRFAASADLAIRSDGRIQLGMDRHDLDRDGQVDLMITTIEREFLASNPFRNFRGFMGGSIFLDIEFYRMAGGLYPDKPDATRKIKLHFPAAHREPGWIPLDLALRGGKHEARKTQDRHLRAFNSILLLGDVIGDGRPDLIVEWHKRLREVFYFRSKVQDLATLGVFIGVPGPDLFAQRQQKVTVAIPKDEEYIWDEDSAWDGEYTWLVDLDKDGKLDVLMHHPSTIGPHRVVMLIAH